MSNSFQKNVFIEKLGDFFRIESKREKEIRSKADELSAMLPDKIN